MPRSPAFSRWARFGTLAVALAAGCATPDEVGSAASCDDVWGPPPAGGRLYADASAGDGGDGSEAAPFATLDEALSEARDGGIRSIALAAGEYPGSFTIASAWGDTGLEIAGCGRQATSLRGVEQEEQVGDDMVWRLQSVVHVSEVNGVLVRDLAIVGGRRAVAIWNAAGADDPIVLERVDVLDSVRLGVSIDGVSTVAQLLDVRVDGVEAEDEGIGWGVAVQTGATIGTELDVPTVMRGVTVSRAQGLGILADGAWIEITDSEVSDTTSVGGGPGRGVHLQEYTRGKLEGVTVSRNLGAAVVLKNPGRWTGDGALQPIEVLGCTLGPTLEVDVSEAPGETAADGLVATQDCPVECSDPASSRVVVDRTTFSGNSRAHAVADGMTMEVGPDNVFGAGSLWDLVSQHGAVVEGVGGGPPGHEPVELSDEEALEF